MPQIDDMASPSEESLEEINSGVQTMDMNSDRAESGHNGNHGENTDEMADFAGLPNILIVTNVDESVYDSPETRELFESVFRAHDPSASFQYLKSFRRARVMCSSPLAAAKARIHLHETELCNKRIKCYFAQPLEDPDDNTSPHLQPPAPEKQFLISPPASPPVGWEPVPEATPVMNIDLLSAIANLTPGEAHELHPPSQEHPGIVVHICEDPAGFKPHNIQQTRCPDRTS